MEPPPHDDAASRRHVGELYSALAAMGFGSAYVATSFVLSALGPVPAAAWRSGLATVLVAVLLAFRGRGPGEAAAVPAGLGAGSGFPARAVRLVVLAVLAGPVFLASMNLAVAHVGAAIASFVAGLYAVTAAVIAPLLLPERLTPRVLAGFVVAVVGTAMLAELAPNAVDLAGIGWGALAATSFGTYLVLTRRWSRPYGLGGMTVALANSVVTTAVLGGALLLTDPASLVPASTSPSALAALVWVAAVAAIGPMLTVASLRRIPAARSAAFLLLNPITATVLAFVLLGERPTALQALGGVLVLAGMAAATLPRSARPDG